MDCASAQRCSSVMLEKTSSAPGVTNCTTEEELRRIIRMRIPACAEDTLYRQYFLN